MSNRIWMSSITGPIGPEQLESFTLELGKIAAFDLFYSLASTNIKFINQSAPNLVTMYMNISDEFDYESSHTRSVNVICPCIEKLNFSCLFGIYLHC